MKQICEVMSRVIEFVRRVGVNALTFFVCLILQILMFRQHTTHTARTCMWTLCTMVSFPY